MRLELRGITKRFGDFTANDSIDLVVEPGQIHAILGENGAGKSTLMNVLYGLYTPEEGEILIDGVPQHFAGPGDAMRAGIGMVHQHFMLVPVFTVTENVVLGQEPMGGPLISTDRARALVRDTASSLGFQIDPDALVGDISVGAQQRVEIVKALSRDARLLILDEPTAVLTPQETDELIEIMRRLAANGTAILFITHKLREIRAVADAITIIRLGRVVGTATPDAPETELASLMVGRSVSLGVDRAPAQPGETILDVAGLVVRDSTGVPVVDDVTLSVARGEILAVAGVQGNGQTELAEAILGLRKPDAGSISFAGRPVADLDVRERLDAGLGYVPEDRSTDGLVGEFSITENLVLDRVGAPPVSRGAALDVGWMRRNATDLVKEFDVRTTSIERAAGTLSGGNQQKVVLARELSRDLSLLVASQPTRGVDVGSIEFLHERIVSERDKGAAVVIVSTELDEVLALGDRIAVMCGGRLVGIVPGGEDRDVLGLMMTGMDPEEARRQASEHRTLLGQADLEAAVEAEAAAAADAGFGWPVGAPQESVAVVVDVDDVPDGPPAADPPDPDPTDVGLPEPGLPELGLPEAGGDATSAAHAADAADQINATDEETQR
ncbi:MAG: ABC transporter ATP-binding protein [Salana multivorans]|uniref:ABC transporter ATP-binding protein n=1 Tax=Salana multivorans TaxID=120377 RepID=UPI000A7B4ECF|nr:ABC transporter ATP-binding protein [Salana multivorans]MBN8883638.1 ABC transporter ATP-binding protein [Salana multivorans]